MSAITLGVADLARARAFYEGLGWETGAAPEDDVVFFQTADMVLALWDRARLAKDSPVEAGEGWGGYSGVFVDPDGHPWEVAHNPHRTLTEDGGVRLLRIRPRAETAGTCR